MGRCSGQGPPGSTWVMVLILPLSVGASGGLRGPTAPGNMEPARGPPRAHSLAGGPPNSVGPLEGAASPAVCRFRAAPKTCTCALQTWDQLPFLSTPKTRHDYGPLRPCVSGPEHRLPLRIICPVTTASDMCSRARPPNDAKSE